MTSNFHFLLADIMQQRPHKLGTIARFIRSFFLPCTNQAVFVQTWHVHSLQTLFLLDLKSRSQEEKLNFAFFQILLLNYLNVCFLCSWSETCWGYYIWVGHAVCSSQECHPYVSSNPIQFVFKDQCQTGWDQQYFAS